jgi:hypothetical protein
MPIGPSCAAKKRRARNNISPRQGILPRAFCFLEQIMRADMFKVLVERPRHRWKSGDGSARRLRNDIDGPAWLRTRAGYGARALNENLAPLRRYLRSQVGRPWTKVLSEICANIDRRNTVQQHIYQHIDDFIAIQVEIRNGRPLDLKGQRRFPSWGDGIHQPLYVDPRTGLIRINERHRTGKSPLVEQRERQQAGIAKRRRVIDEHTLLLLLDDIWYRIQVEALPEMRNRVSAESRHDVILRRQVSRAEPDDRRQCEHLYGSAALYAVGKQQLSRRELKAHRLWRADRHVSDPPRQDS